MKIRNGWVGNSSSSSFIILMEDAKSKEEFAEWFGDCGYNSKYEEKNIKNYLKFINDVRDLYKSKKIDYDQAKFILDILHHYLNNNTNIYVDIKDNLDIEISNEYKNYNKDEVLERLWDAWNNRGIVKFDNDYYPIENNIRVFNEIENWEEQLDNPNSYFRNILSEDIEQGLSDKIDYKKMGRGEYPIDHVGIYRDEFNIYRISDNEYFKNFIKELTENRIKYIKELISEYENNLKCYVITFCTEDELTTDFDYIGRQGDIFRDTLFHMRDENS